MKYPRVLITGGAGLIGRHLVPLLVKRGYQLTVLDQAKCEYNSVESVQGDFADSQLVLPILKRTDMVVHLAAMIGVDNCRQNPEKVVQVNYENTKLFLDDCVRSGVKKILFSSSSEVYGNSVAVPFTEDGPLLPYSVYGKSKLLIEQHLASLQVESNIQVGIVRLFNVYGPGQNPAFVVPLFIQNCLSNKPITIHGTGKQVRCFTYVTDAAEGIAKMCDYEKTSYEVVNIGSKHQFTMLQLAQTIKHALPNSQSEIALVPYGSGGVREAGMEVMKRVPSVEKAKTLLNFEATTALSYGVSQTIASYVSHSN